MPASDSGKPSTKQRQRTKRERAALRTLQKSVEHQVRLAYATIPHEAVALSQARLDIRASLVSRGLLTVEDLESLTRKEAITIALRHLTEQMQSTPPGKTRKRA